MEAALNHFTESGFHGTSTAEISKEAGIATGILFNYFSTKEKLINSLYFEDKIKRMWSNPINWGVSNAQESLSTVLFNPGKTVVRLILPSPESLEKRPFN